MAFTNYDTKEICCKVVYFGLPGSGKTTNLQALLGQTTKLAQGEVLSVDPVDGHSYFDFLPVSLGVVEDFHLKLHIFSFPIKPIYESVAKLVLRGLDGFVFVTDSRLFRLADNLEAMGDLHRRLSNEGFAVASMPQVLQYNYRDAKDCVPLEVLRTELNPHAHPDQEAVASRREGTLETLASITRQVIHGLAPSSSRPL